MPTEYVLQTASPEQVTSPVETPLKNPRTLAYFIIGAVLLVIVAVIVGFIIGKNSPQSKVAVIIPNATPSPTITQTPVNPSVVPALETPNIAMLPDKQYFDDSYVVIQKSSPHATLILSVSRIEQKQNFTQYTHVNYFDGNTWDRKSVLGTNSSFTVSTNPLLRNWNEPSEVVNSPDKVLGSISLPTQTVSFSSTSLQNEISLQSLPGSTKFMYQGTGTIVVDGQKEPAYVYYSRTYSFNASDLSYLLNPRELTSDWMVFWDADGTFYHSDTHTPKNPTNAAQVLRIGIRVDAKGITHKTSFVSATIETNNSTRLYRVSLGETINDDILLPSTNTFDKSGKKTATWYLSAGEGSTIKREGRTIKGVGLIEHIAGINAK